MGKEGQQRSAVGNEFQIEIRVIQVEEIEEVEESFHMHSLLEQDLQTVSEQYGDDCFAIRLDFFFQFGLIAALHQLSTLIDMNSKN